MGDFDPIPKLRCGEVIFWLALGFATPLLVLACCLLAVAVLT